jgi:hypothetical protein
LIVIYNRRRAKMHVDVHLGALCAVDASRQRGRLYTLSNTSIQAAELPEAFVKRLPRYPVLPATLLYRVALIGMPRLLARS